ncbi:NAD(P)-dependent oxidoreductase [Streptomyces sp. NPDC059740]|uniref:NAD(P)-dependent oxidoreductase n=1 Tax=Streptomyces sp. NPDC059740 TaxID=3346926 RepID=UPI00366856B1
MRLTVLGATGGIGRHLVAHALADGHEVTALVRDPARLPVRDERLTVQRGDALDAASVGSVLTGSEAVLSAVGQAGRHDPLRPASSSAAATVAAMRAAGVRRYLAVSAAPLQRAGAGVSALNRLVLNPLLWKVLREVYEDLERMEAVLRESGLDWTSVRPPRLTDAAGTGRYRTAVESGPPSNTVARADVARAMLDMVTRTETFGKAVAVSA